MGKLLDKLLKEDRGVKDILIEMKDLSELSIDLAYSSILFNNKEIAREVLEIEDKVDDLKLEVLTRAMLASPNKRFAEQMLGAIRIAEITEEITDLAGSLADLVLSKAHMQAFLKEVFKETEETITLLAITKSSKLRGKTLFEVDELTDADVIALKRKNQWVYDPEDNLKLKEKDQIIAVGDIREIRALKKMNA